jgi:hypothetical protein
MNKTALTVDPRTRWSKRLLLTSAIFGCATTSGMQTLQAQTLPTTDPMARRPVHAVPLPTNGTDDQASWIIEPDAPRIPKIAGVDATLPPHIERRMSYAFDLAQRGAIYTANSEFRGVLGLCALELDSREGGTRRREALRQGFTALDQSDDLEVGQPRRAENGTSGDGNGIAPAGPYASPSVDPIQAVQARYQFAQQQLSFACQGMPGASLAFYGLGRTMVDPGSRTVNGVAKAAVLQQTALVVAPQNVLAANELGVLLAEHGQLGEAERIFQQCIATNATPETWRNLAAVYMREGKADASRSATAASDALAEKDRVSIAAAAESAANDRLQKSTSHDQVEESAQPPGFMAKLNNVTSKISGPFRR